MEELGHAEGELECVARGVALAKCSARFAPGRDLETGEEGVEVLLWNGKSWVAPVIFFPSSECWEPDEEGEQWEEPPPRASRTALDKIWNAWAPLGDAARKKVEIKVSCGQWSSKIGLRSLCFETAGSGVGLKMLPLSAWEALRAQAQKALLGRISGQPSGKGPGARL